MNPQNPLLSDMLVRLFNSGYQGWVVAAIAVPLLIIGLMVTIAWVRLRSLRMQDR